MSIRRIELTPVEISCYICTTTVFSHRSNDGLCPNCYQNRVKNRKEESVKLLDLTEKSGDILSQGDGYEEPNLSMKHFIQNDRKRCFNCNKKLGLLGVECRCGFVYCNGHRLPQQHSCVYNHAVEGRKKLQKQIIKVYNGKIAQI